jgi:hypothetical protein
MTCGEARLAGAEELFTQGALRIIALVDAPLLQKRHHQIDEVVQPFRRDLCNSSAISSAEPMIGSLRLPRPFSPKILRNVHVSLLSTVKARRMEFVASFSSWRSGSSGS